MAQAAQVDWSKAQPIQGADVDWGKAQPVNAPAVGASPPEEKPEGLLQSLGDQLGFSKENAPKPFGSVADTLTTLAGPAGMAARGIYDTGKQSVGELKQAFQSLREGNRPQAAVHAISSVPILGPALTKGAEQYNAGNTAGEVGTALGGAIQLAPLLLGATDTALPERPVLGRIPTKARGAALLNEAANTVNSPTLNMINPAFSRVNLNRSLPLLEKAQRLSEEGHGTITPLDSLYKRINTVNPLDYDEARSRYSALGNLTGEDRMRATPSLRRATKQFHHAFGEDIGDTAEQAGAGDQYRQGLKTYRRAAMLNTGAKNAFKWGIPLAIGGGIAGKLANSMLK